MPGLSPAALDRRLDRAPDRPLAIAFSGGGDSLALLLLTKAWADAHGRPVLALTVDHGLQPASAGWTEQCRRTAARLGVGFEALRWSGEKPKTGLPAAARTARHRLLADAARAAGARVLLMGHTADDVLEAEVMRAKGSTVGDPREWSPSPAWPEGRGLFLLRPLLTERRPALRDWLTAQGETWIEDPANGDGRSLRARVRNSISAHPDESRDPGLSSEHCAVKDLGPGFRRDERWKGEAGGLITARGERSERELAAACLCAAGTTRPPRGERLARLAHRLNSGEAFTATLAGARIEADAKALRVMRDAGEAARGGLAPIRLTPGEPAVWDGRFELTAARPLAVCALAGHAARLPPAERAALAAIPAAARPALPAIVEPSGVVHCPLLASDPQAPNPQANARPLALERFRAAMGFIEREADL